MHHRSLFSSNALRRRFGAPAAARPIKVGDRVRVTLENGERKKGTVEGEETIDGELRLRVRLDGDGAPDVEEIEEEEAAAPEPSNLISVLAAEARKLRRRA